MPDMVAIGNEVICGMLWPDGETCKSGDWDNFVELLQAGIDGVKQAVGSEPMPLIMIHIDRGGKTPSTKWFFDKILAKGVEFDVIGQSYYPWWHGSLSDLTKNLEFMVNEYGKDIYIVETGYNWSGRGSGPGFPYPKTPEGQKAFLEELIKRVKNTPNNRGKGVFYWSPDWTDGDVWGAPDWSPVWEKRALFNLEGNMLPGMTAFLDPDATPPAKFKTDPVMLSVLKAKAGNPIKKTIYIQSNYKQDFEVESVLSRKNTVKIISRKKIDNHYELEVEIVPPPRKGKKRYFSDMLTINIKGGEKLEMKCVGIYKKIKTNKP